MDLSEPERQFLAGARVARLATADGDGRPSVVPICFALLDEKIVTPIDEKPKDAAPSALRRVRDIQSNPHVAVIADRYDEDWSRLGWVQVRGTGSVAEPGEGDHPEAVAALRARYDQYAGHALEERPLIRIEPRSVRSWGRVSWDEAGR